MAGKVLQFTNGYPGTVSRSIDDIIESIANADVAAILFGAPVALKDGNVVNVSAENTDVIGIAIRTVKTEKSYGGNDPQYESKEMVDVLKRGSITVYVPTGEPKAGDLVYIVKATGAFATAADGNNTIATRWKFKGGVDSNKVAEIVLTERAY